MNAHHVSANSGSHRQPEPSARAMFMAEQRHLGAGCDFPGCERTAELGTRLCDYHVTVRIASNGSWVDDNHADGGHG